MTPRTAVSSEASIFKLLVYVKQCVPYTLKKSRWKEIWRRNQRCGADQMFRMGERSLARLASEQEASELAFIERYLYALSGTGSRTVLNPMHILRQSCLKSICGEKARDSDPLSAGCYRLRLAPAFQKLHYLHCNLFALYTWIMLRATLVKLAETRKWQT